MRCVDNKVVAITGAVITLQRSDTSMFKVGELIRLGSSSIATPRPGRVRIIDVGRETGVLQLDAHVNAAIPSGCVNDHIFIEDEDHEVLVAYLLSAVRRGDWHAVSDAANDLRVLEASRR